MMACSDLSSSLLSVSAGDSDLFSSLVSQAGRLDLNGEVWGAVNVPKGDLLPAKSAKPRVFWCYGVSAGTFRK